MDVTLYPVPTVMRSFKDDATSGGGVGFDQHVPGKKNCGIQLKAVVGDLCVRGGCTCHDILSNKVIVRFERADNIVINYLSRLLLNREM
jgi:hypothetical protein